MIPGLAASALAGNLPEIQILRPPPQHTKSEILGGRSNILCFNKPSGDPDAKAWEPMYYLVLSQGKISNFLNPGLYGSLSYMQGV